MINTIMVATGGSSWSMSAVEYAVDLAKALKAQFYVVHVVTSPSLISELLASVPFDKALKEKGEAILRKASTVADREGVKCETLLKMGSVPENVVMAAVEKGIDLLIMGSRGEKGIMRGTLGGIASKVAAAAPCPVLIVKDTSILQELLKKGALFR
jgi:nucleotide-binding universal stress UspA family protein